MQRLACDEAIQDFDTEGELALGEGSILAEVAFAEPRMRPSSTRSWSTSRPVRTNQPDHATGRRLEGGVVHGDPVTEALGQPVNG